MLRGCGLLRLSSESRRNSYSRGVNVAIATLTESSTEGFGFRVRNCS